MSIPEPAWSTSGSASGDDRVAVATASTVVATTATAWTGFVAHASRG